MRVYVAELMSPFDRYEYEFARDAAWCWHVRAWLSCSIDATVMDMRTETAYACLLYPGQLARQWFDAGR